MIRITQNGRVLCTTKPEFVLDDRIKRDDLIWRYQVSIFTATKRKASNEATRSNVQARSELALELTRGDKRALTALDRKLIVPQSPTQRARQAGVGGFLFA